MKPSRRMSETDAIQILKEGTYGVLSTSSRDGNPYGVPLNYFYVPEDHAIYFHCFVKGRKLDNIMKNDRVSFVVVGNEKIIPERFVTHYESVVITGTASLITDDKEKTERLLQLCKALAPTAVERREEVIRKQLSAVVIVKVKIEEICGKRNRDD